VRLAELLRLTAVGIALLCWLDPPVIVAPAPHVGVDAAIVRSPRDGRLAANGTETTVGEEAERLARQLSAALAAEGTVRTRVVPAGEAVPCDALQPCVVITEGAAVAVPDDRKGPVSIVRVGGTLSPNVELRRLSVPPAHLAGQATALVSMASAGSQGRESRVRVFDGEAVVGEASHHWTADGEASLEIPWWPIAAGDRTLVARVVTTGEDDRATADDEVAGQVYVEDERWPIVMLEPRASWAATFVRRALEQDERFTVGVQTRLAPRVSVSTPGTTSLDDLNATRVVVVGGPEARTADDVAQLDRFVRERGGAVVLVPDRPITGPATRLVHHRWHERLEDEATAAGPLRASEWLVAADVGPLDLVWSQSNEGAAVVATPVGGGIVVVSGALDAWRHRTADGAFDSFWRGTVARLATGVGPSVALQISGDGEGSHGVTAQLTARTTRRMPVWTVTASRRCGNGDSTGVRLWPADATGAFAGRVPIGSRDGCRLEAEVAGLGKAAATLDDAGSSLRYPRWDQSEMRALTSRTGGLLIEDGDLQPLVRSWLDARGAERRPEPRYPMRSWWWLVPIVASLATEWWLRRRVGLR
jgi:hypothetical protein